MPLSTDPQSLLTLCDDALMQLAKAGHPTAFATLFRRHHDRILRLSQRNLRDRSLAPDVTQNTFIALYDCLQTYQPRGKFRAFLSRLAINHCRTQGRSCSRKLEAHDADHALLDRRCEHRSYQHAHDVELAMARLSDKLRSVVALRFEGKSLADIAAKLQLPLGTVKRRLSVAKRKLRVSVVDNDTPRSDNRDSAPPL